MIQQLLLLVASVLVSGDPSKCVVEAPAESGAERTAWEALIWPVGSDVFFKDHYERAPLHLRRASHPEYWEDRFKLTQQTLETLLEMQGAVREDPVSTKRSHGVALTWVRTGVEESAYRLVSG